MRDKLKADEGTLAVFEALDAMSDGFALFDNDDRLVFCTRKYQEIYPGLADLLAPGTGFETIVRESVRRGVVRLGGSEPEVWIARRMEEHRTGHGPTEHQLYDGRWIRATDFVTERGYHVTRRTDVTAEKTALSALSETEERLRDFADSASDFFWEMDANLRFSYFSERFSEVSGVPAQALLGRTRQESGIEHMTDPDAYCRHLEDLTWHRPFRNFVHPRRKPDGSTVWLAISGLPVFDGNGDFRGYRGTGRDITDMVEANESLKRERNMFTGAMESMSDGFALFDADDRLVFCNSRFRSLNPDLAPRLSRGMTFENMLRDNIENGRILDAIGREKEFFERRMEQHRHPTGEGTMSARKDGRWLLLREQRMPDGSTFLINSDMTALKNREEALRAEKERAEQANRAKTEFLANMSHELRTPLNAIIGFSEMLLQADDRRTPPEKHSEYAENVLEAGNHLLFLINDILDMTKIEAGEYSLDREIMDLVGVISTSIEMVRPRAAKGSVEVVLEAPRDLPLLEADERAVRQMLLNLLSNAVKFTPAGGRVTVRAACDDDGLTIAVADTGVGMTADLMEHATEPFVQGRDARNVDEPGTGLGLAITRRLAEMHGGRIRIESRPGSGTTVSIRLPPELVVPRTPPLHAAASDGEQDA